MEVVFLCFGELIIKMEIGFSITARMWARAGVFDSWILEKRNLSFESPMP